MINPYVDDPVADENDDDDAKLREEGFQDKLVDMSIVIGPNWDAAAISNQAIISHLSMAMGLRISDNTSCEVFESMQSIVLRAQTDVKFEKQVDWELHRNILLRCGDYPLMTLIGFYLHLTVRWPTGEEYNWYFALCRGCLGGETPGRQTCGRRWSWKLFDLLWLRV